ncbi:MAG: ATP-binding protein [Gordonia sp. (in: high G+C Gram-positive bacteria)]
MTRFVAGGFFFYFLVSWGDFGSSSAYVADWFTPVAAALAFVPALPLGAYSFVRDPVHRIQVVVAYLPMVGYLAATALWLVAWDGVTHEVDRVTWLANFAGLPGLAIALVHRLPAALIGVTAGDLMSQSILSLCRTGTVGWALPIVVMWNVAYASLFLFGIVMTRRTGRMLDETRETALAAASTTAEVAAREVERSRFDALVHDQVIATLLAADSGIDDERLARQARTALAELDALTDSARAGSATPDEAVARIRVGVAAVDDAVEVVVDDALSGTAGASGAAGADWSCPTEAAAAVGEATAEAVRNSLRHGGPGTECVVFVELAQDVLRATAVDDGPGFDVDAVPPERLGIEVSIRLRMAAVPGGGSRLHSTPGVGTTVQVWWQRP